MSARILSKRLVFSGTLIELVGLVGLIGSLYFADERVHAAPAKPSTNGEAGERRATWQERQEKSVEELEEVLTRPRSLPDLDKLKELGNTKLGEAVAPVGSAAPLVRNIQVTLGPPRSEVFVAGRLVGKTPYLGQWSCREGDVVKVDVVPPKGAPIAAKLHCVGPRLVAK